MAKKAARKDSTRGFLLQFLYGAAIGLCGVHSLMAAVEASASFGQYLFCVVWMLCVLFLRRSVLPVSWGDVCDSICLTVWVTHDPSTGVRATTSLRGERAQ